MERTDVRPACRCERGGAHFASRSGSVDEAGQRELIELIVELHNKGISIAELTQLVNDVTTALAKPAPSPDSQFDTRSATSSPVAPASDISAAPRENATSASTVFVNSRRLGAADFVDLRPSSLESSSFFPSNVRKTFAPHHTKQLVADPNDSCDDGPDSREICRRAFHMGTMSTEPGVNETSGPGISVVGVKAGVTRRAEAAALQDVSAATHSSATKTPLQTTAGLAPASREFELIPSLNQEPASNATMQTGPATINSGARSANAARHEGTTSRTTKSYRDAKQQAKKAASLRIMREKLAAGEWDAYKQEKREKREKEDEDKRRAKEEEEARKARKADQKRTPSHTRPRWTQARAPTAIRQASRFQHAGMPQSRTFAPSVNPTYEPTVSITSATSHVPGFRQADADRGWNGPPIAIASSNPLPRFSTLATSLHAGSAARLNPANADRRGQGMRATTASTPQPSVNVPIAAQRSSGNPVPNTTPNPRCADDWRYGQNRGPRTEV